MKIINSWKNNKWLKIKHRIFLLQIRIYKASKNKEWNKVHKLQSILLNSNSAKFFAIKKIIQKNFYKYKSLNKSYNKLIFKQIFTLINELKLDTKINKKKNFTVKKMLSKLDNTKNLVNLIQIKHEAKQILVMLALSPQWEPQFEPNNNGYQLKKNKIIKKVNFILFKKANWVLNGSIENYFNCLNYQYLIQKCNANKIISTQLTIWFKTGLLDEKHKNKSFHYSTISYLLMNIALHGLEYKLKNYILQMTGYKISNLYTFSFVRYNKNFLLMHVNRKIVESAKQIIIKFLKPLGLNLNRKKTQIVYTQRSKNDSGFTFLDFNIRQQSLQTKYKQLKKKLRQNYTSFIIPSKKSIKQYKSKLKKTIFKYRGLTQDKLIIKLNSLIRCWMIAKKNQHSSKILYELDIYLDKILWNWCRRRHNKLSNIKIKEKYFRKIKNYNWIFNISDYNGKINLILKKHILNL